MKITKIDTLQVPEHPHIIWVRIHTDEGIVGYGETTPRTTSVQRVIHDIAAGMLIGENPLEIEKLWHDLFRALHYHGYAGSEMRAVSAIDMALWDILGRASQQPIYRLLGGKVRNKIPIYNTCVTNGEYTDQEMFMERPGELAKELLDQGISGMKIWPFDDYSIKTRGHGISTEDLKNGISVIEKIRSAAGNKMDIALEGHACWDLPTAIRIARALEEYDLMWLEDMIPAEHPQTVRQLRESTSIPLSVSERLFTRFQFLPYMEQKAVDYVMPDICWVGGITEIIKIADLASTYHLSITPHNCGGPIQTAAYMHCCSHSDNVFKLETVRSFYNSFFSELVTVSPVIKDGYLHVSDEPGLGTELSPNVLQRDDLIIETSEVRQTVPWTSGNPWSNDLGNHF